MHMINILINVLRNVNKVMYNKTNIVFLQKINLKNKTYILIVEMTNILKNFNVLKNANITFIKVKLIISVQRKNHVMKLLVNQL